MYADDLVFPGMLWGRTIRSEIPRGQVRGVRREFDETGFTIVDYRDVQFTKTPRILDGMGLAGLEKSERALDELRSKGLAD